MILQCAIRFHPLVSKEFGVFDMAEIMFIDLVVYVFFLIWLSIAHIISKLKLQYFYKKEYRSTVFIETNCLSIDISIHV